MKKNVSLLLACAMLVCVMSLSATAAGEKVPESPKSASSAVVGQKKEGARSKVLDNDFTSTKSSHYKWKAAHDSFYNGYAKLKGLKLPTGKTQIRGKYVYTTYYLGDGTKASLNKVASDLQTLSPDAFEKTLRVGGLSAKLNTVANGEFYGETGVFIDEATGQVTFSDTVPFTAGDYVGRESMTITEGVENQLLSLGFCPDVTTARSVIIFGYTKGVYFRDGNKTAFLNSSKTNAGTLSAGMVYSLKELGKDMQNNISKIVVAQ